MDVNGTFGAEASRYAGQWDRLFFTLVTVSGVIIVIVLIGVVGFSIRYRKGSSADRSSLPDPLRREIEIGWTTATAIAFLMIFWWAAATQLVQIVPPKGPLEIHVFAKQWMWKVQQPNGVREINELHAPVDRDVRLVMTSEDVIHSMFLPSLRLKQDVLPGRYTYLWFKADKPGTYHLLCAEFCGTEHSRMVGRLVLMTQDKYARWSGAQPGAEDLSAEGEKLFNSLGCTGCHAQSSSVHAPDLHGLFGGPVQLSDHRTVTADEKYLRDSILQPSKDVVAGFEPIMPSFSGIVGEDQLIKLIAYLKSLSDKEGRPQ